MSDPIRIHYADTEEQVKARHEEIIKRLGNFVEPNCKPYGGGFGVCGLFDGSVGGGEHILLIQVWLSFIGLPFGSLAFLVYALLILGTRELASAR